MKKVSIIVPTFGRPEKLEKSINSILRQSYKNIEIIIVNDNDIGSSYFFETKNIIEKYKNNHKIVYYENKKNLGGALSRNNGVRESTGYYVTFLDDDDEYEYNKVEEQVNFMEKNLEIDCSYVGMKYLKEKKIIGYRDIFISGSKEIINDHIYRPITGTPALMIKKKVFDNIGGFDNLKRFQDANLLFKILVNNYKIAPIKKFLVIVNVHGEKRISNNGMRNFLELEYLNNCLEYSKYMSNKQINFIAIKRKLISLRIKKISTIRYFFEVLIKLNIKLLDLKIFFSWINIIYRKD